MWRCALVTGASSGSAGRSPSSSRQRASTWSWSRAASPHCAGWPHTAVEQYGVRAEVIAADLADGVSRAAVEARLADGMPPVDLLVNCAGGGLAGPFLDGTLAQRHHEAELNCLSVLRLCHVAATAMAGRGRGTVVNVASDLATTRARGLGVRREQGLRAHLSATLRYELHGTGVGVTAVATGPHRTRRDPGRRGPGPRTAVPGGDARARRGRHPRRRARGQGVEQVTPGTGS